MSMQTNEIISILSAISVIERCKLSKKMMDEFENLNYRPQFVQSMGAPLQMKQNLEKNKSPLIMNNNNVQFLSQSPVTRCRDALINYPFKNLNRNMFELTRTLGVDIAEISRQVQNRVEQEKELAQRRSITNHPEPVANVLRIRHFGMQTMKLSCEMCKKREDTAVKTVAIQADFVGKMGVDKSVQTAAGTTDSFSYFVESMRDLSEEQIIAIEVFKRAMNIRDDGSKDRRYEVRESRERSTSDYMSWSNPENPNSNERFDYLARSPNAERYNDYRGGSPKRKRIGARLGDKVPSPIPYINLDDIDDHISGSPYGESSRPKRQYGYVPKSMQRSPKRMTRDHSPGVPGIADPRDYYQRDLSPSYRVSRNPRDDQIDDSYTKYERSRSRSPDYSVRRGRY